MGPQSCVVYRWDQKDPAKKPKKTADPTPAKDVYALGQLMHEVFIGGKFAHAADGSLDVSQIKSGDKVGRNDCLPFLRKEMAFHLIAASFRPQHDAPQEAVCSPFGSTPIDASIFFADYVRHFTPLPQAP